MNTEKDVDVDAVFAETRKLAQAIVGPLFDHAGRRIVELNPTMPANELVRRFAEAWNVPDRMS